jgi:transcriptional regulator with XRE-family HTH domain
MTQEDGAIETLVRKRIRALRISRGWSLGDLAERARMSPSTLSRIEGGTRRLALDQLITLARALDTSLDELVDSAAEDVISSPTFDGPRGSMRWSIRGHPDLSVIRQRLTEPPSAPTAMRAHAGREWFVVLSGTAGLLLGDRRLRVEKNQAAEFPTMLPHAIGAEGGRPCEILGVFDREARREHLGRPDTDGDSGARAEAD